MGVSVVVAAHVEGTRRPSAENLRQSNLDGCVRGDGSVCRSANMIHFARDPVASMLECALRPRAISVEVAATCPYAGR